MRSFAAWPIGTRLCGDLALYCQAVRTGVSRNPRVAPFARHHRRYDDWFERHQAANLTEPLALRALLPWDGCALEIGVGTGRFVGPLGVQFGIDPAAAMLDYARAEGCGLQRLWLRRCPSQPRRLITCLP